MKLPKENLKNVDIADLMETFADSIGKVSFDGLTLRLDDIIFIRATTPLLRFFG